MLGFQEKTPENADLKIKLQEQEIFCKKCMMVRMLDSVSLH